MLIGILTGILGTLLVLAVGIWSVAIILYRKYKADITKLEFMLLNLEMKQAQYDFWKENTQNHWTRL